MNSSYLVRRILISVAICMTVMIILSTLCYTVLIQTVFADLREKDLTPKAAALGAFVRECIEEDGNAERLDRLMEKEENRSILGAFCLVVDTHRNIIFSSGDIAEGYDIQTDHDLGRILDGQAVTTPRRYKLVNGSIIKVGMPVYDSDGNVIAAVLLFEPMRENTAAIRSLYSALLLSAFIALPIAVLVSYVITERFTRPLRQMNQVALSMAAGNFSTRADASQGGEIGELASSLNFLARELSGSISDLTLERNRLRDMMNGMSEGMAAIDTEGNITHTNTALAHMFSKSRALSDGSIDAKRLALIPFPEVWEDMDNILKGGETSFRTFRDNGSAIMSRVSPLCDENGTVTGALCILYDVTQSEKLEATRREYVANVSHELRRPLTALRGLVEPMREGLVKNEETRMRYYDIILRETMRLSRLINDLMELSRLQSGTLTIEYSPVDMNLLLGDIREKYTASAAEKGLSFRMVPEPGDIPDTWSNPDRVEEILVILLDNAIKYTPEDGGTITLSAESRGRNLVISVADTGIGISEEDLPYIFDRFYKADKAHSEAGSGLGLSIAKEMSIQLGGSLTVDSRLGEGSVFRLSLPLAAYAHS